MGPEILPPEAETSLLAALNNFIADQTEENWENFSALLMSAIESGHDYQKQDVINGIITNLNLFDNAQVAEMIVYGNLAKLLEEWQLEAFLKDQTGKLRVFTNAQVVSMIAFGDLANFLKPDQVQDLLTDPDTVTLRVFNDGEVAYIIAGGGIPDDIVNNLPGIRDGGIPFSMASIMLKSEKICEDQFVSIILPKIHPHHLLNNIDKISPQNMKCVLERYLPQTELTDEEAPYRTNIIKKCIERMSPDRDKYMTLANVLQNFNQILKDDLTTKILDFNGFADCANMIHKYCVKHGDKDVEIIKKAFQQGIFTKEQKGDIKQKWPDLIPQATPIEARVESEKATGSLDHEEFARSVPSRMGDAAGSREADDTLARDVAGEVRGAGVGNSITG